MWTLSPHLLRVSRPKRAEVPGGEADEGGNGKRAKRPAQPVEGQ